MTNNAPFDYCYCGCDFFTSEGISHPKDYKHRSRTCLSIYSSKDGIKKDGINGKKFPEWEKDIIFPQTDDTGRKLISDRNEHEPALTCPHRKKCRGYTHEPTLTCPHRKKCGGYTHEPALTCLHRKKCGGYTHEPALTCPHRKKCGGYTHSSNKAHCETYANDTCKIFWEAFHAGSAAGGRWLTPQINSFPRNELEALQEDIKSLLKKEAQKPKTELNPRNLGFWHGAFLRLKTISPEA